MKRIILFGLGLLATVSVSAQVVVNEFSASNLNQFTDNYNNYEDWIELYNTSGMPVNIGGYFLSDSENNRDKYQIPAGTTIPGNGYMVFWCDGRDEVSGGEYHTSFKLNQTKGTEEVVFSDPDTIAINNIPVGITQLGHSHCRDINGGSSWVVDITPTPGASNGSNGHRSGYAQKPQVNVTGGFYSGSVGVQLANNPANATVRYTTDGTLPTTSSPVFPGALVVSSTQVLKLRSFSNDANVLPSLVEFNTYLINENFTLPVFSVAADEVIDLANGNQGLRPHGSAEYFNVFGERTTVSYGELNSHGQDSWVNFQRSLDWISRDEMGYSAALEDTIFSRTDRDEYQRIILRASGDDNYPADNVPANPNNVHDGGCHTRDEYVHTLARNGGMKLDVRAVERAIVFLNGQYWGVYALREKPNDHDYTEHNYDQDKYEIQWLSTWGNTEAEYGGQQAFDDWGVLRDFILNNDMSVPANYQIADDGIQFNSLIDYMVTNLNVVASDWLNYNTAWWRGLNPDGNHKGWGYMVWDLDATFDYYINYSGVPSTQPDADACDIEDIADFLDNWGWWGGEDDGKHEQIFLKLLDENPDFEQLYYSRYADHMNTIFSCDNMLATFDSMVAVIAPEMPRHIQRWGGTMTEWEGNVQEMRDFIETRCTFLGEGMVGCYDITGPFDVTVMCYPPNVAEVKLNTLWHPNLPWTGSYFGNMDNLLDARLINPNINAEFSHWESTAGNIIFPHSDSIEASVTVMGADTLIAVFDVDYTTIDERTEQVLFEAYPVPATNDLNIKLSLPNAEQFDVVLYTIDGKAVMRNSYHQQVLQTSFETNSLARGLYILSVEGESFSKQLKIPLVE
ncbi:MAG: CotH kinase family protein [Flavobacteriales bacterium]|nr:CotH kinase family protein [Flavobacteriales bacterium]MCB9203569.1 CotH kinase family protein [Flavobacteriales bacterium]